ncbi:MAG: ABC transporter permease [Christensenellales bacterium]
MKKYVLKRLLSLIPTIFIVSVVIFLLVHLTPGDPAAAMLGEDATAAEIAALHTQLGLDDPLVVQYFRWVGNCLRLDFGTSTAVVNKPVSEMIASHFQPTILLAHLFAAHHHPDCDSVRDAGGEEARHDCRLLCVGAVDAGHFAAELPDGSGHGAALRGESSRAARGGL